MNKKIIIGVVTVVVVIGIFMFLNMGDESIKPITTRDSVEGKLEGDVTEVVYYQKDERYFYEIELLGIVLENTVDEYGPYLLRPQSR